MSALDGRNDDERELLVARCSNPGCRRLTITFNLQMVVPLGSSRVPAPAEVPENIAKDYAEACLVEPLSAKASAALARRCLQNILSEKVVEKRDLNDQITEAITKLPADLADNIDAIRVVGNFAAHPNKSKQTGVIVDVEQGEAGYLLDILGDLFDFYYVRPARSKARKDAIQAKIDEAGSGAKIK
jgi:hypothetical protein